MTESDGSRWLPSATSPDPEPPRDPAPPTVTPASVSPADTAPGYLPDPPATEPAVTRPQPTQPAAPTYTPPPASGVPARPAPLPPPRPVRAHSPAPGAPRPDPRTARPVTTARPVARTRKARLVLKRIDPWSVFLYSVVASIFVGIALIVAVGVLYAVLSKLGVLASLNTLINDVTADPGSHASTSHFFSLGKVMTFATLIAALDVILITALATLGAFLYNLCAALTGGIEVTLTDQA